MFKKPKRARRLEINIPSKYILLVLSIFCIVMMILSFTTDIVTGPLETVAGYTIVPFQKGISQAGAWLTSRSDDIKHMDELVRENAELKEQVNELTVQINNLQQDKYELSDLRQLFELNKEYSDYDVVGARIIGKDAGNWFNSFLIDKGTKDGIMVDMNVMAGSGLVGLVTEVGPNWACVKSIIDDTSNVSGMVLSSADTLIVTGNLELLKDNNIEFSQLNDSEDKVVAGDHIVTSYISDKYLPGISIGYITEINKDANNLTKSGYLAPVVDFKHLENVLVITELKTQKDK